MNGPWFQTDPNELTRRVICPSCGRFQLGIAGFEQIESNAKKKAALYRARCHCQGTPTYLVLIDANEQSFIDQDLSVFLTKFSSFSCPNCQQLVGSPSQMVINGPNELGPIVGKLWSINLTCYSRKCHGREQRVLVVTVREPRAVLPTRTVSLSSLEYRLILQANCLYCKFSLKDAKVEPVSADKSNAQMQAEVVWYRATCPNQSCGRNELGILLRYYITDADEPLGEALRWFDNLLSEQGMICIRCGPKITVSRQIEIPRDRGDYIRARLTCDTCGNEDREYLRFRVASYEMRRPPINRDEVIDTYELLKNYHGNMEGLFPRAAQVDSERTS